MQYAVSILLSGVSLGGQYALIAIGYTMVYGILRLINFAHGDEFMVAGLIMVYLSASLPLPVAVPLMILLTVVLGFLIERAAYKPLRSAPRMSVMISGIKINSVISVTFIIGSLLAAVGSMLYFTNYPSIVPLSGALPGLRAFVAAVFGGIGSIPGAVVGAFLIGICESIIKGSPWSIFSDAFTFALLIVILVVKPTGLFGEKVTDKV